jgi:hypothetical protein
VLYLLKALPNTKFFELIFFLILKFPFSMKKVIPIVAILLIASLVGYKWYTWKHPQPDELITKVVPANNNTPSTDGTTTVALQGSVPQTRNTVNIQLEPVVKGVRKGVIEVGASGFNAFAVDIDQNRNWELVSKTFGKSMVWDGFANAQDIIDGTKEYISALAEKGIAGRNIHFIVSSGAAKVPGIDKVITALKTRYTVNVVTADEEGKFACKALLPKAYRENSFCFDMGSGNTKINWYENGKIKTIECPGAKYYAINKTDQEVYNEVVAACNKVPASLRNNCFVLGGVPFSLAKESRSGDERFTPLLGPDSYSAGDDAKKKCGLNIYRAIYETTGAANFYFDWDANFTIGYLLSMN